MFTKYVYAKNDTIPDIDFAGSIAFTRDSRSKGIVHKLIKSCQTVHSKCHSKTTDIYMCHGLIIMDDETKHEFKNEEDRQSNSFVVAHGVFDGIRTSKRNYLKDRDVTEIVIYKPNDEVLRKLIIDNIGKSVFDVAKYRKCMNDGIVCELGKAPFSYKDMITALSRFYEIKEYHKDHITSKILYSVRRICYIVADLIKGNQILSGSGKTLRSFFCTPYAIANIKASIIMHIIGENEINHLKELDRETITDILENLLVNKKDSELYKKYWETALLRSCDRFIFSCYACDALNALSTTSTP